MLGCDWTKYKKAAGWILLFESYESGYWLSTIAGQAAAAKDYREVGGLNLLSNSKSDLYQLYSGRRRRNIYINKYKCKILKQ